MPGHRWTRPICHAWAKSRGRPCRRPVGLRRDGTFHVVCVSHGSKTPPYSERPISAAGKERIAAAARSNWVRYRALKQPGCQRGLSAERRSQRLRQGQHSLCRPLKRDGSGPSGKFRKSGPTGCRRTEKLSTEFGYDFSLSDGESRCPRASQNRGSCESMPFYWENYDYCFC